MDERGRASRERTAPSCESEAESQAVALSFPQSTHSGRSQLSHRPCGLSPHALPDRSPGGLCCPADPVGTSNPWSWSPLGHTVNGDCPRDMGQSLLLLSE